MTAVTHSMYVMVLHLGAFRISGTARCVMSGSTGDVVLIHYPALFFFFFCLYGRGPKFPAGPSRMLLNLAIVMCTGISRN